MEYIARPHQEKAVIDVIQYLSKNKKPGLVVAPTAAGKSWIIADLIDKMGRPATMVLQPSKELLKQNYAKYTGPEIGGVASLYSASVGKKEVGHITYATPGSVKGKEDKFSHIEFVIIDEAHLGTGSLGMIDTFISNLSNDVKVIGLTATPIKLKSYGGYGDNYSKLNILTRIRPKFWSKIIHVTQVQELYDGGYLCPLRFTTFNYGLRNVKTKGSDFDLEEVSKVVKDTGAVKFAANLIRTSLERGKKKILVFTATVEDSYALKELIPEVEIVSSKTKDKERTRIVEGFVDGEIRIISNYGTLTTGFDAPSIDLIICLRPTKSYAIWYQLIGRGIRIKEGKEVCDVLDLSGNYKVFGDPKDLIITEDPDQGWGMYVEDYLITGIPIGQKVHKKDLEIQNQKISFGKYKGTPFKEVPTHYLEWVRDNFDLTTSWAKKHVKKPLKKLGIL